MRGARNAVRAACCARAAARELGRAGELEIGAGLGSVDAVDGLVFAGGVGAVEGLAHVRAFCACRAERCSGGTARRVNDGSRRD